MALNPKTRSQALQSIIQVQQNPFRMVCKVFVFKNPLTNVTIRLHPLPMVASKAYFDKVLHNLPNSKNELKFDKILVEDGYLPFVEGTPEATKTIRGRSWRPFIYSRPVVPQSALQYYDGLVQRNPIESRICHYSVVSGEKPTVDPRARRALEHADAYSEGTVVVMPWNIYHCVYIKDKLLASGYHQVEELTEEMLSQTQFFYFLASLGFVSMYITVVFAKLAGVW